MGSHFWNLQHCGSALYMRLYFFKRFYILQEMQSINVKKNVSLLQINTFLNKYYWYLVLKEKSFFLEVRVHYEILY